MLFRSGKPSCGQDFYLLRDSFLITRLRQHPVPPPCSHSRYPCHRPLISGSKCRLHKSCSPMNSPTTPNNPFPRKIANTTQKGESPVDSPSIFGPIILPSTCCKIMINSKNITPFDGLSSMMSMVLGMAPMYGQIGRASCRERVYVLV